MKKIFLLSSIVAVAAIVVALTAFDSPNTVVASKNVTSKTRILANFTEIEVGGAFQIDVTYSATEEKIEVEAPDNLHDLIITKVSSGKLMISMKRNTNVSGGQPLKIHITTAQLNHFELSGAASISLNNTLKQTDFSLESSGAASFNGEIVVNTATIELSGASSVDLDGAATTADLELSGASHFSDYTFSVQNLTVNLSGASHAAITTSKSVKGDVSGASSLKYKGQPGTKNVQTSGASSVKNV